jgi:lysophospholipase L1-like esterase
MKPTQAAFWPEMSRGNRQIAAIAKDDPHLHFIDADPVLLTAGGKVNAELLRFDGIHLNDKGYAAWTSLIKPALLAAYGPAAGTVQ